ncbi:MAG: hypothetical protein A3G81_28305 [Betaproteobacteria bacterium RIFCSPLOWO2_12_FULL_65_14]|nr:MAG: hypothetical protein A3G81_28305 [Betaproteobacteria bacterium RIFCSPLOWO2_12_FULL_65_14]
MHEVDLPHNLALGSKQSMQEQQASASDNDRRPVLEEHFPVGVEQERTEQEGLPGHAANLEELIRKILQFFGLRFMDSGAAAGDAAERCVSCPGERGVAMETTVNEDGSKFTSRVSKIGSATGEAP